MSTNAVLLTEKVKELSEELKRVSEENIARLQKDIDIYAERITSALDNIARERSFINRLEVRNLHDHINS